MARQALRTSSANILLFLFLASLGSILGTLAEAQVESPGTIFGKVLDHSRVPVAGAQIMVIPNDGQDSPSFAVTNGKGEFSLEFDPGFYTFRIVAPGFHEIWQTVVLRKSGYVSCDFIFRESRSMVKKKP